MMNASSTVEVEKVEFDRDAWLAERRKAIGASDVSSILGLNPWGTAWEVWADKLGKLESFENKATDAGNRLEGAVLDYAEGQLGALSRNQRRIHATLPLAATCDAIAVTSGSPVEAKTTGIVGPVVGQWGDELTDQIPDYYLVQVHAQLMCTQAELGYLFALLPGRGFCEFRIEPNQQLHEQLGNMLDDWWQRHIVQGIEPPMTVKPRLEVVKRLRKTPNKVIEADAEFEQLLRSREALKDCKKQAEDQLEDVEARLLIKLGDAEAATLSDGRTFTYLESKRKSYTVAETTFRTMRIKKAGK